MKFNDVLASKDSNWEDLPENTQKDLIAKWVKGYFKAFTLEESKILSNCIFEWLIEGDWDLIDQSAWVNDTDIITVDFIKNWYLIDYFPNLSFYTLKDFFKQYKIKVPVSKLNLIKSQEDLENILFEYDEDDKIGTFTIRCEYNTKLQCVIVVEG